MSRHRHIQPSPVVLYLVKWSLHKRSWS